MHCVTPDDLSADGLRMMLVILASTVPSFRAKRLSLPTARADLNQAFLALQSRVKLKIRK